MELQTRGRGGGRRAWIVATTIGDLYDFAAAEHGTGELVFPGERCTYAELGLRADDLARSLAALRIGAGDHVGLLMLPGIEYFAAMGAIAKLGGISVPINSRFKARELAYVAADAELKSILVSPALSPEVDYPGMLGQALPGLADEQPGDLAIDSAPRLRSAVLMGDGDLPGYTSRAAFDSGGRSIDLAAVERSQERVRIRDIGMIMYTSGTESSPKGCLLSHEALVRNAINVAHTRFELTPDDRMWNPLPQFHTGGIVLFLACLSAGAGFVHAGIFDPGVALDQLVQERITVAHPAFETIWLAVLNHPRFADADLSHVRLVLNVGVPERLRLMQKELPHAKLFSSFGSTEASSHLALTRPDDDPEFAFTTGGHPMPGMEVRVVDPDTGDDLPPDTEGEVLYRGSSLFDGYQNAPELTAQCIDEDGWFHSKDVGVVDPDGRLTFKSRLKDMLKVGGENVGAAEIEGLIAEHPAVQLVQVVSAPDAKYTEVAAAFVQLKAGAICAEAEIIRWCIGKIASYARFVEDWPMSGTKIRKTELRDRIAAELADAGITEAPPLGKTSPSAPPATQVSASGGGSTPSSR
jgi:fatty-acyl-CoA synthase